MKLVDREVVDGTSVTIGRKVHYRNTADGPVRRVARAYSAVYAEAGSRRFQGLGTTNKREARRRAIEIQKRLDAGERRTPPSRTTIVQLIDRYEAYNRDRDLAPKTRAKYTAEFDKLRRFCRESGITRADRFDAEAYAKFGAWLRQQTHKQGTSYASKSNYTTLTVCKQMFKWAWLQRLAPATSLASARLPTARPKPQPCFTTQQVEGMLGRCEGVTHAAIAILAYTGLRVGELEQLHWSDVHLEMGELGMLHVHRGGSSGSTKDREARFVPIDPKIRPVLDALPRDDDLVLPELRARTLLAQIKRLCIKLGYGRSYKTHSLRHHFASSCANSSIPYRMALAWMGHSSSSILDLYYHLHDAESEAAMIRMAEDRRGR
ncbi:MAG: site-specific integrase [Phycisphaera sp.]|nr:MAG: site-specific integrase [Phycisphaera sp.]